MTWEDIFKKEPLTSSARREELEKRVRSLLEDLRSETEKAIEGMQKKIGVSMRDLIEVEDMLNDAFEGISSLNKHVAGLYELRRGE